MPINLEDNEILLRCACHSAEHIAFLIHDEDTSRENNLKGKDDDWYLAVLLDPIQPWWKRVWRALRPNKGRYGFYAELVLTTDDVNKLADFIYGRISLSVGSPREE